MLKHCAKESDWSMDKKYGQRVWTKELSLLWIAAMDMVTVLDDTHEVWRGHGSWKGRERKEVDETEIEDGGMPV